MTWGTDFREACEGAAASIDAFVAAWKAKSDD